MAALVSDAINTLTEDRMDSDLLPFSSAQSPTAVRPAKSYPMIRPICVFLRHCGRKIRATPSAVLSRLRISQRLRGEPVPDKYELTILAEDERRIRVEVKPSVVDYAGHPATLVVARDMTARKQAETALRQANEEIEQRVEARTAELQAANAQRQREIAERGQVEATLRATETKYRTMIERVNALSWSCKTGRSSTAIQRLKKCSGTHPKTRGPLPAGVSSTLWPQRTVRESRSIIRGVCGASPCRSNMN
jgi:hypothetical protein